MQVAGIGGANMDIHGRSTAPIVMRDSNPGSVHLSPGGVSRNILENLCRMGVSTSLLCAVGNDTYGRLLLENCDTLGMDTSRVAVREGHRSSSYISILDDLGDMLVAISDMEIMKSMGAGFVNERLPFINSCEVCVCDANLSPEAMAALVEGARVPVFCDPVSTAWAKSVRPVAHRFFAMKPNLMELETLAEMSVTNEALLQEAADRLLSKGLSRLYVSLGADGIYYRDRMGNTSHKKSRPFTGVVNATGAGDAAMAGLIWATLEGLAPSRQLEYAAGASLLALASPDTISKQMSILQIETMIKEFVL